MTSGDGISMNGFVNPRWALDMIVVSSEPVVHGQDQDKKDIQFHESISMDDENSPGVFHVSDSVHCQVVALDRGKNEILHPVSENDTLAQRWKQKITC